MMKYIYFSFLLLLLNGAPIFGRSPILFNKILSNSIKLSRPHLVAKNYKSNFIPKVTTALFTTAGIAYGYYKFNNKKLYAQDNIFSVPSQKIVNEFSTTHNLSSLDMQQWSTEKQTILFDEILKLFFSSQDTTPFSELYKVAAHLPEACKKYPELFAILSEVAEGLTNESKDEKIKTFCMSIVKIKKLNNDVLPKGVVAFKQEVKSKLPLNTSTILSGLGKMVWNGVTGKGVTLTDEQVAFYIKQQLDTDRKYLLEKYLKS